MYFRITLIFILLFSFLFSNAQETINPPEDTLKIISWNIHLLPYFLVYPKSKKRKRTKLIAAVFNQEKDYDILALQEVFHKTNRRLLKRKLKKKEVWTLPRTLRQPIPSGARRARPSSQWRS